MQRDPSDTEGRAFVAGNSWRYSYATTFARLQRDLPLPGFHRFAVLTPRLLIDAAPL